MIASMTAVATSAVTASVTCAMATTSIATIFSTDTIADRLRGTGCHGSIFPHVGSRVHGNGNAKHTKDPEKNHRRDPVVGGYERHDQSLFVYKL
jgi:hypothetical protein